ncbi:MAG: hypothetical protein AB1Y25_12285 [Cycloclasticus sp.]
MNLKQFCNQPDTISPEESQLLNRDLSSKVASDIPHGSRKEVEEYICNVLLHDAVEADIKPALDLLLESLRDELSQTV